MKYGTLETLSWRSRTSAKGSNREDGARWKGIDVCTIILCFPRKYFNVPIWQKSRCSCWMTKPGSYSMWQLRQGLGLCPPCSSCTVSLELKIPQVRGEEMDKALVALFKHPYAGISQLLQLSGLCWAAHPRAGILQTPADLWILNSSFTGIKDFLQQMLFWMFVCFCLSQPWFQNFCSKEAEICPCAWWRWVRWLLICGR